MTSGDERDRLAALAALGLGADASGPDILSAYRRLARSSHPDTADGSDPGSDFAHINAAYRFLTHDRGDAGAPEKAPPQPPAEQVRQLRSAAPWDPRLPEWDDDRPLVAGPVIIRPLRPEAR